MKKKLLVEAKGISLKIKDKSILENINLTVSDKEIVTIVGPNGAGKSTLLSIILKLQKPTEGILTVKKGLKIGFVPQNINQDESLPITVNDFINLSINKLNDKDILNILKEVAIEKLKNQFIYNLSGGELRRVLFARALITKPELLVLDEPTSGVDVNGQIDFYKVLNKLQKEMEFSVLMVSHDLHLVMAATDRVICLNKHICCSGNPAEVINNTGYTNIFGESNDHLSVYKHTHDHKH